MSNQPVTNLTYGKSGTVTRVLRDDLNAVVDLTGVTDLRLVVDSAPPGYGGQQVLSVPGQVVDPLGGLVQFAYTEQQTRALGPGGYYARITWDDGAPQATPVFLAGVAIETAALPDTQPPYIDLQSHPADENVLNGVTSATFVGTVVDQNPVAFVNINGVDYPLTDNAFSVNLPLGLGANAFTFRAVDSSGNRANPLVRTVTRAGGVVASGAPYTLAPGLFEPSLLNGGGGNYTLNGVAWIADGVTYDEDNSSNPGYFGYAYDDGGVLGLAFQTNQGNLALTSLNYDGAGGMNLAHITDGGAGKHTFYTALTHPALEALLAVADPAATLDYFVTDLFLADANDALGVSAFVHPDYSGEAVTFELPYAAPVFAESGPVRTATASPATLAGNLYDFSGAPGDVANFVFPNGSPPPDFSLQGVDENPTDVSAYTASPGTQIGLLLAEVGGNRVTLFYSPEDGLGAVLADLMDQGFRVVYYDGSLWTRSVGTTWTYHGPTS